MGELFSQICIALFEFVSQLLFRLVFSVPSSGLPLPTICLKVSTLHAGPLGRAKFSLPQLIF